MRLDVQWDGYPLRWKLGDLHARQRTREPVTYPVAPADDSASCYWAAAKRMVSEVDYVALFTWIKSINNIWTNDFQTVYIYVDDRLLGDVHQRPDFWPLFSPWIKARCAHLGPYREHTTAIHVPIGAITGLNRVHFTWAGTFVLEAFVYLFASKNFILIDTDCVPTSLFEVEELARLMLAREDETKDFGSSSLNSHKWTLRVQLW